VSGTEILDVKAVNNLGYDLMNKGMHQRAIDVLRVVVHMYPESANAHDSLGDAYLSASDTDRARDEFQRALALALAPTDVSLSAESRLSLVRLEREKLRKLKP
jgi:Flp pilus assembly protein TadD